MTLTLLINAFLPIFATFVGNHPQDSTSRLLLCAANEVRTTGKQSAERCRWPTYKAAECPDIDDTFGAADDTSHEHVDGSREWLFTYRW